ncbi:acetoacetate--CoA ligase [Methylobacterium oxalidis]
MKHIAQPSQMSEFQAFCERRTGTNLDGLRFHDFSVREFRTFWSLFLEWSGVECDGSPELVCTDDRCEFARFFPNLRLSYPENLLRTISPVDDARIAITSYTASGAVERLTRGQLRQQVMRLAVEMERLGIGPGDRVVSLARNRGQAVIGALATAAVGAIFSSAALEMGVSAILGRFQQLKPKAMMLSGTLADRPLDEATSHKVDEIIRGLPDLSALVLLDDGPVHDSFHGAFVRLPDILADLSDFDEAAFRWKRFPFNHPLFILFTSGTTGLPKCLQHGAGGTLLEHLKEHRLHADLRANEKLFFYTTTAWMMWNWQLSALAVGCEIVLYDAPLSNTEAFWRTVSEERVSVLGTSPPFLRMCEDAKYVPSEKFTFEALRAVQSTGSILDARQYDWVRQNVKDVPVQSISGGTDIIGCFVLGHPDLPVRPGESQCRSLGLDVQAYQCGAPIPIGSAGDLVCCNPFPSCPIGFFGDDGTRFHKAYFSQNDGIWTHGDRIVFSEAGGAQILGRTDSTINVNGIRIGPSEIYRVLSGVPEVAEAMAIEQQMPSRSPASRIVLLIVPRFAGAIDSPTRKRIRRLLAQEASPAHVPGLIAEVSALPLTHTGKRSETAARDCLNGVEAVNSSAIANPDILAEIRRAVTSEEARISANRPEAHVNLEDMICQVWESALHVSDIDLDDNFFDLGGTSLSAIRICQTLSERLNITLGPWVVFQAPTVRSLTSGLRAENVGMSTTAIQLRAGGPARPLFIFPGMYGDVIELRALVSAMRGDRPVYGIRSRGLAPGERPHTSVEAMAHDCLQHLRALQPSGPYYIAGYSFGGLIAWEVACLLRAAEEDVAFLGLIDAQVHERLLPFPARWTFRTSRARRRIALALRQPLVQIANLCRRHVDLPWPAPRNHAPADGSATALMQRIGRVNMRAFSRYRPQHFDGAVTFFRASSRWHGFCDSLPVWIRLGGEVAVCELDGGHTDQMREPFVTALAEKLLNHAETAGENFPRVRASARPAGSEERKSVTKLVEA